MSVSGGQKGIRSNGTKRQVWATVYVCRCWESNPDSQEKQPGFLNWPKNVVSWVRTFTAVCFLTVDPIWPVASLSCYHPSQLWRTTLSNDEPGEAIPGSVYFCWEFRQSSGNVANTSATICSLSYCDWLPSHSAMSLRIIPHGAHTNISFLFKSESCSLMWHYIWLICLPRDTVLLSLFGVGHTTAMNIGVEDAFKRRKLGLGI